LIEAAAVVFLLFFLLWPLKVTGVSMSPTLDQNDRILVSRAAALFGGAKQGDIVICYLTDNEGNRSQAVRRVIAVPGDVIAISGGAVSVNGQILTEDYIFPGTATMPDTVTTLERNQYFVMGDNRPVSGDSRNLTTPVERGDISAKVVTRFFPFGK
jgi:signal peptidase I